MSHTSRLTYIRDTYGVPAKRGALISWSNDGATPRKGTIVGALNGRLRVRFDDSPGVRYLHPTWGITYL